MVDIFVGRSRACRFNTSPAHCQSVGEGAASALSCILTIALFLLTAVSFAANEGTSVTRGSDTHISPGDVLLITVWGEEKWSGEFPVDNRGVLYYPPVGDLEVDQMTAKGLTDRLTEQLKELIKRPRVTVVVRAHRGTARVGIWGEVVKPGVLEVPVGTTVFELLTQAERSVGAARKIQWIHSGAQSRVEEVDYEQVLKLGGWKQANYALEDGDTVLVPKADKATGVTLLGQVHKPGTYPWHEDLRLLEALMLAEGLASETESQTARILRSGKTSSVIDLERLLRNGDLELNAVLEAGDIVIAGTPRVKVAVLGQVTKPGNYNIPSGSTVFDALTQAGGPTDKGDINHTEVVQGSKRQVLNLWKVLWEGDTSVNITLSDGDVVFVPPQKRAYLLGAVQRPGEIAVEPDTTLLTAMQHTGEPVEGADLGHVRLIRRGEVRIIDATRLLSGGDTTIDLRLEPGDSVFVPLKKSVYVVGAVNKAGPYPIGERTTLMDLVRSGAAPMPEARMQKVMIIRTTSEGKAVPMEVNLERLIKKGDSSQDVVLQPGDLIMVPGKKGERRGSDWWQYAGIVNSLAWLLGNL